MSTTPIDFTEWTDAQLDSGARFTTSPNYPALAAEIARRKDEGIPDDGSKARVAEFVRTNTTRRRRRRS